MRDYAKITTRAAGAIVVFLAIVAIASVAWRSKKTHDADRTLATMAERTNHAHTLAFDAVVQGAGQPRKSHHVLLGTARHYQKTTADGMVVVQITDYRIPKTMLVFSVEHKASVVEINGHRTGATPKNLMAMLRQVAVDTPEYVADERVNGAPAVRYRRLHGGERLELWLDAASSLPVRVVVTQPGKNGARSTTMTMSNMQWDAEVDPALFSVRAPDGHDVVSELKVDLGDADAGSPELQSFAAMRNFLCRLDDDQSPDELMEKFGDMHLLLLQRMTDPQR